MLTLHVDVVCKIDMPDIFFHLLENNVVFLYYDIFYFVLELFTTFQEFENPLSIAGDARDMGLILEVGRSPRLGNGTLLQYSCLESSIGRGGWQAADHGATKSCIEL